MEEEGICCHHGFLLCCWLLLSYWQPPSPPPPYPRDEFAPISEGLCLAQAEQCTIAAIKRYNYLLDNFGTTMEILRVCTSHFEELDF